MQQQQMQQHMRQVRELAAALDAGVAELEVGVFHSIFVVCFRFCVCVCLCCCFVDGGGKKG